MFTKRIPLNLTLSPLSGNPYVGNTYTYGGAQTSTSDMTCCSTVSLIGT